MICAQCCGEKRILEIDCPETCGFLIVGRDHEVGEYKRYLRRIDPARREAHERVLRDHQEVIALLEAVLARQRLSMRDLTDRDVAGALDLLLESYRTEDKGILYEKSADDLQIDSLRRMLRQAVESCRNPGEEDGEGIVGLREKRLPLRSAIECLEFVRDLVAAHVESAVSSSSYVDLLARLVPREAASGKSASSIIIP